MASAIKLEAAVKEFVQTIDATGGVVEDGKGNYEPVADREWIDLGHAYVRACDALGREPIIVKGEEPYDDVEGIGEASAGASGPTGHTAGEA